MPSPAAASAVRPPGFRQHRGMRSFDAKSRRLFAWKARVSRVNTSSSDVNVNPLNGDADVVALVGAPGESGVIPASAVVLIPTSHLVLSGPLSFDTVVGDGGANSVYLGVSLRTLSDPLPCNVVVGDGGSNSVLLGDTSRSSSLGSFSGQVRIWSVNVCKLMRRKAELEARLRNANVDILLLQETWLSDDVEEVRVAGFYLVGRLDRSTGPKAGFGGFMHGIQFQTSRGCRIQIPRNACGVSCTQI